MSRRLAAPARACVALVLLAAAWSAPAATPSAPPAPPPPVPIERLIAYDATTPLDVRATLVRVEPAARVYDVTYASPRGGRVTAYLVTPAAPRPSRNAGLLFGHWGGGNRTEFLAEAIALAPAGAVSLLPDYPWTRPAPWHRELKYSSEPEHDVDVFAQAVVDLRRGLDLLLARDDVDPARLAYVGHSYGAQWGAILAAHDRRVRTAVLVAGVPDLHSLYVESGEADFVEARRERPEKVARLLHAQSTLAAARHVGRAAPIPLLFQMARFDPGIGEAGMRRYVDAASEPKELRWYPTGHELFDPRAAVDRARWLHRHVGLDAPPASAVGGDAPDTLPSGPPVPPMNAGIALSDDGLPVFYVDAGSGDEALVLIHGGFVDHRVYREQMALARELRVVALDLGGHGLSGHGRARWTLASMGADVRAVVRALGLKRVVLAGSSMGGPVALEAARQMPGVAAGVIGVDSLHDAEGRPDPKAWAGYVAGFRKDFAAAREAAVTGLFHPGAAPAVVETVRRLASESDPRVLPPLLDAFSTYDEGAALTAARVPVRCVNGDLYPTNETSNRKYEPTFRATVLRGVGHYPMLERPEAFNREVLRFARELLGRPESAPPTAGAMVRKVLPEWHARRLAADLGDLLRFRTVRLDEERTGLTGDRLVAAILVLGP